MDFYQIKQLITKNGTVELYPDFKVCRSKDLMVRGKSFYAVWDEEAGMWSTDEYDVQRLVDRDLYLQAEELEKMDNRVKVKAMSDFSSKSWKEFRAYMNHISDNAHQLDAKLTFSNTEVKKNDYISRKLSYPLEPGSFEAYDEIIGTLYSEEERAKLEWAIGSIIAGDSKNIQKFLVLYGDAGAGKSTILNIIQKLFDGYYATFDAKALTNSSNSFSTEAFRGNPLVAIQHDGDLSRIDDNTKLNSIVSHEEIMINEKFKPSYAQRMNCFLFMATNKPIKITDAKSGLIRRLIDVKPTGNKIPAKRYNQLMKQVDFELGAIAYHCLEVYQEMGRGYYSSYRPVEMMYKTDPFFNFVEDRYLEFLEADGVSLKGAYAMYKEYCQESNADYTLQMYKFREELKNYFYKFEEEGRDPDGKHVRNYYSGFNTNKFKKAQDKGKAQKEPEAIKFIFKSQKSAFDKMAKDWPAQYATDKETPKAKWSDVETTLGDISSHELHYVKVPENHIVIDFDIKDEEGNKSFEKNLEAANKWPLTYAELSKSGAGIHLHYIYTGDPKELSRVYDDNVEIKVFTGNSSLRRKLVACNDISVASISSGLPLKQKGDKMVNQDTVKSEKGLRTLIKKNLNKEIHAGTKPSVDFIFKILEDAYNNGLKYDVTDMRPAIMAFAANSSHQSEYCLKLVSKMKFKSDDPSENGTNYKSDTLIFYDVEVFPNLFLVNWKMAGPDTKVVRMINPTPTEIEDLLQYKLVGFNCRRYDNHIMYARMMGYTNEELYRLSQRLINADRAHSNAFFGEAYNLSYTDVYDFASAGHKQSLKKFEIELGIHHQELGLPWDEPVDESLWPTVAEYCDNDVIATEATFNYLSADWTARQILADLADGNVNDTTNSLTTRIIFGNNRKPQNEFCYRDLSKPVKKLKPEVEEFLKIACPEMMSHKHSSYKGEEAESYLPYFPGYKYDGVKSTYRGEDVGEGGYVYSEPGMYTDVALLDVSSMHPHSTIAECLFGPEFTTSFRDIVEGRVSIKHEAWSVVNGMLNGKLTPYIQKVKNKEMTSDQLADALKTAINSVYGLTAAKFENPFKDPNNIDNIVAKRGALFMIDLKNAVQSMGYTVCHIKTDSIKIPNATPEIIKFVMDFGLDYGYTFEHEATYDRICLVNDAVYIAKYTTVEKCEKLYGKRYLNSDDTVCKKNKKKPGKWDATGTQFQVPYVFKTLFSGEQIEFNDLCETKSVTSSLYLDFNENLAADEHDYRFIGKVGSFCPIKPNAGGGQLMREKDGKYSAATGTKGYRWLEAEMVKELHKEDDIDRSYYNKMVDAAVEDISKYGDFEWFANND